jgi:hypothetical protein
VYLALDREAGEHVALKKLSRMNPVSVLRFKREFRALANIHHRNLVQLYELEHAHDGWCLTMELVEGIELLRGLGTIQAPSEAVTRDHRDARVAQHENDEARLSKLVDAFSQLAQAIHAIHQAGFLHRDLKPSNVMLEREGRVVVLDFGLVRELTPSTTVSMDGVTAGTPAYMPPEQVRGEELSEASDWYAFGVMLYEALSGALPIDGRSAIELLQRKLQHDPAPLSRRDVPPALRDLCTRLLRRDPLERPTAREVIEALSLNTEPRIRPHAEAETSLPAEPQTAQSAAELFGRDAERVQLGAALETALREHTTVAVHVRGPSGAGKTALVQAFLSESGALPVALSGEPLLMRSRCYEREAMPFKAIDGAVDALATHLMSLDDFRAARVLPPDVSALTALFPVFERVPAVRRVMASNKTKVQGEVIQLRRRAEEGFRHLLHALAAMRPLVIWIDDLQWGDLDSTLLLQDWLRRPIQAPLLLVLTYRGDEVASNTCLSALVSAAARSAQLACQVELDLQPLRESDVHSLCSQRISGHTALAPPVIARIVRDARGNPYLATQLAALARAKLERGETDLTALSVNELVLHTSALLHEPAQRILRVLAVAGRPLALRIVLGAAEVERAGRGYIHELQSLRLVRTRYVADTPLLEVYHDGLRESVHASLSDSERQRIHASLLQTLLHDRHADPAWLHELALGAGERSKALQFGVRAAQLASENLAFERAAELYARCVQLADSEHRSALLWKELAVAHARCSRGIQAADAYLKASAGMQRTDRAALVQLAASHLVRSGRFDEGERLVQQVMADLRIRVPTSDIGLYAAIGLERARIAVLERVVKPRKDVVLPPAELQIGMFYGLLALDTQCYMPLRATLFQTRATRLCFQHGESQTTARAYCMNAVLSTLSADGAAASRVHEMLARAEALIDREANPDTAAELYAARATCAMFLGHLASAIEPSRIAEELYASKSVGGELGGGYFFMFVVRLSRISALQFLGRHIEAADEVRRLLVDADATSNRCAALQATTVRTVVEQAESGCRDSRSRLDAERTELPSGTSVLHMLHLLAVIRTACATGDHDWASGCYAELEPKLAASPLWNSAYLVCMLRQNHARLVLNQQVASGSSADPEPLVREHVRWLAKKGPLPLRKSAPLRILARVALLRGERESAAELLQTSRREQVAVGAADDAERDRYALGLLIGGDEGTQLTTAASAALRAMGLCDPERDIRTYFPELVHGA